jgi:hypothetical protein
MASNRVPPVTAAFFNMKKENRGGKREGAGRKLKYGELSETITFRVPVSKKTEFRHYVTKKLKQYERN